jgi:AmiR/NasT family two-component response regulator
MMTTVPLPTPESTPPADPRDVAPAQAAKDVLTETEKFILEMLERLDAADSKAEHLQLALNRSRDIGAAVGILMAQHKVQQADAFDLLRRTSQDQNRKLHEVALAVVSTGELPHRESKRSTHP